MINRSKMRRQLYRGGGITRQRYGLGDLVRKLIPNELADVAVKAAPFVAPFNPGIAGLMRGIGRYDQRGSLSDALKQGVATTALGAGARYLGGAAPMGGGLTGGFTPPIGPSSPFQGFFGKTTTPEAARTVGTSGAPGGGNPSMFLKPASDQSFLNKVLYGSKEGAPIFGDKGLIGAGGSFDIGQSFGKGLPAVFAGSTIAAYAAQKALGDVGERESGESLEAYNKRRKGTVGQYLDFYFRRANRFRIPPEDMDAAAAKFVEDNTKEYVSHGGRIGYQTGGITMANTLQENIRRNQAQQQAVGGMFEAARSRLPGYVAPTTPEQKATVTATNLTNSMLPRTVTPEVALPRTVTPEESPLTVMPSPQYKDPLPKDELMSGFEEYIRNNPDAMSGIGTSAMMPVTLPGGYEYDFSGSTEATAFNKYLDSIGQAPYTRRQSPINMKGPLGIVPSPFREDPGDFGPDGIVIDGKRYYSEKEAIADMGIERYNMFMSKGGRVGQMRGTGPNGLPGIPRMAPDGMEFDMRQNGGFQPLGAKEKKDDVPAMLAKNEFVFTADAVRGAGNGDIELGAQKMYDTMKNLERRVT